MKYNPQIHHRKSIRLKGYDYSQAGLYFITICCQDRSHLFGYIENGKMILNNAGEMVEHWYFELENKFNDIKCHEMIIMPNHFHCIIENVGAPVGADQGVCPDNVPDNFNEHIKRGEHVGSPLGNVMQWFKTMTTNHYIRGVKQNGWKRLNGKLWQRNYWEHIIRNENAYQRISQYIINNPQQWDKDTLKK